MKRLTNYDVVKNKRMASNESKVPIVRINNELKKYKTMPIFQKKVDEANEMLRTIGLPKLDTNKK